MAGSPTDRRVEEVVLDAGVGASPSTKVVTFTRQTGPAASLPPGPFNVDPGSAFTPTFPPGNTISAPRGTVFPNLLSTPNEDFTTQSGVVSASFAGAIVAATVLLTKVELVNGSGAVTATILDSAVGIALTDSASILAVLGRIPVKGNEALRVTLTHPSAGALTGSAKARYDLGLNAQQPEVFSTPGSL